MSKTCFAVIMLVHQPPRGPPAAQLCRWLIVVCSDVVVRVEPPPAPGAPLNESHCARVAWQGGGKIVAAKKEGWGKSSAELKGEVNQPAFSAETVLGCFKVRTAACHVRLDCRPRVCRWIAPSPVRLDCTSL